jgi:hypothetical protein
MAISRNLMERQLRAGGGIMTLEEPRQGYFLGKIVKKAKKAVKKVVKSPVGKLALLGAAGYGLGGAKFLGGKGIFAGGQGLSRFSNLANLFLPAAKSATGKEGILSGLLFKDGAFSPGRAALTGLGATAIAAPFFMGGDEEVEPEESFTGPISSVESIRDQARQYYTDPTQSALYFMPPKSAVRSSFYAADGGLAMLRPGYAEGGLMDLGGYEKDYREGGFVPLGAEERADDVPARLSKNEFVFTADAVRNAGGGDIDKGAEVMQNMMDNLEAGGTISEESQGKNPAQAMFDQAQQLESRIA